MKRILAVAASAALALIAGCTGDQTPTDIDAVFDQHLPWNPDAKGVQTDESGLQWIVIREGDANGASPEVSDLVSVDYEGRTADGEKFDSSFDRGKPACSA